MFVKNYTLMVNKPYDEAIKIFEDNLDDMTKKGYSMSGNTVIHNSDHRLKLFTGEFKNGAYIVRSADSSDMFYRYLPKMRIEFVDRGNQTEINVKSKHIRCLLFFVICAVITIATLAMAILLATQEKMNQVFFAPVVPVIGLLASMVLGIRQLNDGKASLEYIYKD